MHVQDEQRWAQHLSDIQDDGEAGQRFHQFFLFWFETADTILDTQTNPRSPAAAARAALEIAETELGFLDVDLLGQMLCVAVMHWGPGAALAEQLTNIEERVLQEALARKIAALQDQAAAE